MNVSIGVAVGLGKSQCEDTALFNDTLVDYQILSIDGQDFRCMAVADGVGGMPGGHHASGFVTSVISRMDFSRMEEPQLRLFLEQLNEQLIRHAASVSGEGAMATTLTCVVAASDGIYLLHAGNTRLYVLQGAYLKQLTKDQTTYRYLMDCGEYEAAAACNKSEIYCCLGGGDPRYANRLVVQKLFEEGLPDTVLLTSDGVHEYVDIDDMEEILNTHQPDRDIIKWLLQKAVENGSCDDRTAIIARK